jgi:hypothetical protein
MSRITCDDLVRAVARIRGMDAAPKEQLVDQLFRVQPYVVASFWSRNSWASPWRRWISWSISCSYASRR